MNIEEKVFSYILEHENCTRVGIQRGLGMSLGEVNGCILVLGNRVSVVDKFELPTRFVVS